MIHWPGASSCFDSACRTPMNSPSARPAMPHGAPQCPTAPTNREVGSHCVSETFKNFPSTPGDLKVRLKDVGCIAKPDAWKNWGGCIASFYVNIVCMYINYIYVIFICITKGRWGDRRKWGVPLSRNPTQNLRYAICAKCRYVRLWQISWKYMLGSCSILKQE